MNDERQRKSPHVFGLALRGLQNMGFTKTESRRVPEDISLIGFDDNFHARHLTPGLTTVRQPVDAIGRMAAELLAAILRGEMPEATAITVPTELVVRQSAGRVARGKSTRETAELAR